MVLAEKHMLSFLNLEKGLLIINEENRKIQFDTYTAEIKYNHKVINRTEEYPKISLTAIDANKEMD